MRVIFGLLGIVLTLFVVVQLVKIQTTTLAPATARPAESTQPNATLPIPQGNPKQVQEQYQQSLDGALKAGQERNEAAEKP